HNGTNISDTVPEGTQIAELIVRLSENTSIIPTTILLGKYATKTQINANVIPLLDEVGKHFVDSDPHQTVRMVPLGTIVIPSFYSNLLAKGMCSWEAENVTKSEASFKRGELLNCLHLEGTVQKVFVLDSNVVITTQNKKNYLSQRVLEY